MPVAGLRARWQHFWWGPVDARPVAALRIGLALVAITVHISWWPEVDTLLDAAGQARNVVAPEAGRGFSLFCLPEVTGKTAHLVHGLTLVPLVGLLLGVGGRFTAVLAWLVVLGWYQRAPGTSSGGDRLLRFGLLYLSVGASTARWSLDAWWRRRRGQQQPTTIPALPLRLIQVQWAAMYLLSGLEKAQGGTWRHGTALHFALSNRTFARFGDLFLPLVETSFLVPLWTVATWAVLLWELSFPLLVVGRRTRRFALLAGVVVHLGIGVTMSVGPFTLVTLVGYIAFLDRWADGRTTPSAAAAPPISPSVQSSRPSHVSRAPTEPLSHQESS